MDSNIRPVSVTDADAILSIYRPYVENTAISFEEKSPDVREMCKRITTLTQSHPWLVYETGHELLGYAYATSFRARAAYRHTSEVTIYLADNAKGTGVASQLYQTLLDDLASRGFYTAIAVVTEPNPASEKFHQNLGFRKIGVFESVGYKLGRWHDTGWWQKQLSGLAHKHNNN